jgi:hypothetical protein
MSKDHPVGNADPNKRGRDTDPEPYDKIGQRIPNKVRKQIEPKDENK